MTLSYALSNVLIVGRGLPETLLIENGIFTHKAPNTTQLDCRGFVALAGLIGAICIWMKRYGDCRGEWPG